MWLLWAPGVHSIPGISQFQMCPVTLLNEENFSPCLLGNEIANTLSFPHKHVRDSLFSIFGFNISSYLTDTWMSAIDTDWEKHTE